MRESIGTLRCVFIFSGFCGHRAVRERSNILGWGFNPLPLSSPIRLLPNLGLNSVEMEKIWDEGLKMFWNTSWIITFYAFEFRWYLNRNLKGWSKDRYFKFAMNRINKAYTSTPFLIILIYIIYPPSSPKFLVYLMMKCIHPSEIISISNAATYSWGRRTLDSNLYRTPKFYKHNLSFVGSKTFRNLTIRVHQ